MFEYVRNEFNPRPSLVVDPLPTPAGALVADLEYSVALRFGLPATMEELRNLHGAKYWSTLRRKERRLAEHVGDLRFRMVSDEAELVGVLPQVQRLFEERWSDEYTSCPWKTPAGFAPYADAMLRLAREGRAVLAALEGDGRLLSFAYCLYQDGVCHFYQHASTREETFRRYSVGRILVVKLIEDLVRSGRCATLDFMTGAADYKLEWTRDASTIYFRVEEQRTLAGRLRFVARLAYYRLRFYVQFDNAHLRAAAKRLLRSLEQARAHAGKAG